MLFTINAVFVKCFGTKIMIGVLAVSFINYLLITNIVDMILLGRLTIRLSGKSHVRQYAIKTDNRIDIQTGFQCSAFSTAYVLRHFGMEADGDAIYLATPYKMKSGYVYPKGVRTLLRSYGLDVKYCRGNLNTLKADLQKGCPVVVMIRVRKDRDWLHYVPVVGYDEEHLFLAESLSELINCECGFYNRKVKNKDFLQLWNTAMVKQPFYKNTYFLVNSKKNA